MRELIKAVSRSAGCVQLLAALNEGKGSVAVFGMHECCRAVVAAVLAEDSSLLIATSTDAEAVRFHAELSAYLPEAQLFLPRDLPIVDLKAVSSERRGMRLSTLIRLCLGQPTVIVTCAAALLEQLAPKSALVTNIITVSTGDSVEPRGLMARLIAAGYERCDLIEGAGQCALRGDILDVFPPQAKEPCRIEFFGDEIDQIRFFDPLSQRSTEQLMHIVIPPAFETPQSGQDIHRVLKRIEGKAGFDAQRESWEQGLPCVGADVLLPLLFAKTEQLTDYLPQDCRFLLIEPERIADEAKSSELMFEETVAAALEREQGHPAQARLIASASQLMGRLDTPRTAGVFSLFRTGNALSIHSRAAFTVQPAPQYLHDLEHLGKDLIRDRSNRDAVLIYAGEEQDRVLDQLSDLNVLCGKASDLSRPPERGETLVLSSVIPRGFVFPELHLTVLSPLELFGKRETKSVHRRKNNTLIADLKVGDCVVHETHGVGRFKGVVMLTAAGSTRDYLLIEYREGDKLYIPTDQLDRVQKYLGGDAGTEPSLSKLGSGDWGQKVNKAKASAKKLAIDLAKLYAERSSKRGFAFSRDNAWQKRMEESFPYTETPDQLSSAAEIKADMEKPLPMDRLLCGDVGYGKTEVTLRAAFKAIQDSKQVALMVPTTILAQQHYNTVLARFRDFPIKVACLSRFGQPKERENIKRGLASGEIDMVIGTHALLAKSVSFHDLGLLIIDEEHRFGVNHKERIKELKSDVDVLTLTATPIPRTLNLSLTGIRDISVIDTPPENRYPVQTFVMEYSDALVRTALSRELARGGQAFVLSNKVDAMDGTLRKLRELLPDARIDHAHGQMPEHMLEQAMVRFINHETDILLCSTIIESGVDIPNANTLVVLDADHLGLAQLYQLRGRVGRSTRMAYAYFTVYSPRTISESAQLRLSAIREFTQFGSGYRLAMRDLEIRGAGSLLGAEQHGHISDIGFDYYCKLIRQAVSQAKGEKQHPEIDVQVNIQADAFVPQEYVRSEVLRLSMYKRIAGIEDSHDYDELFDEYSDRYGEPPAPVVMLMKLQLVKAYAQNSMINLVSVEKGKAVLRYCEGAQTDGARLLAVVGGEKGAKLIASNAISIELKLSTTEAMQVVNILIPLLARLSYCSMAE